MTTKIHLFEQDGLGRAPFRVVGIYTMPSQSWRETFPGSWMEELRGLPYRVGSCQYCYTGLTNHYIIKDADGKRFCVGSECVKKSGDVGLVDSMAALRRQVVREKKDKVWRQNYEAKMSRQRQIYAGLTKDQAESTWSMIFRTRMTAIREAAAQPLAWIIDALADGAGGFRDVVAGDLRQAHIPKGRVYSLVCEIVAKQLGGRRGSRAYEEMYDKVDQALEAFQRP